jgi:hypothetical protein
MPFHPDEWHLDRLDRFLHQPGPQTTGTYSNSLGCTFHKSANRAEVGTKDSFRPIIGVTDIISNQTVFPTHVTCKSHCMLPGDLRLPIFVVVSVCYHR